MIKKIIFESKLGFIFYKILIFLRRFLKKKKRIKFDLIKEYSIIGEKNYQTFTGYYDVNLISFDEKSLLYHKKKIRIMIMLKLFYIILRQKKDIRF